MSAVGARMGVGRADRAPHPCQGENAEQDQHDADREFHRQTEPRRNDDPEHDDRCTDRHDRDGVSYAPGGADQRRARHAALAADDRRDGDDVVGVGRMPHPEEEAEKQEGHDVQGGSGHCARAKVMIPGPIMQGFDPTPIRIARRAVGRCPGRTVVTAACFLVAGGPWVRPAPGIACTLLQVRDERDASLGHFVPRECGVSIFRHCEERSDLAIQIISAETFWIASPRS